MRTRGFLGGSGGSGGSGADGGCGFKSVLLCRCMYLSETVWERPREIGKCWEYYGNNYGRRAANNTGGITREMTTGNITAVVSRVAACGDNQKIEENYLIEPCAN